MLLASSSCLHANPLADSTTAGRTTTHQSSIESKAPTNTGQVEDGDGLLGLVSAEEFADDMEVAETHLFRPLFQYRAKAEKRRRIDDY